MDLQDTERNEFVSKPTPEWARRSQAWDQFLESAQPEIGFMQASWWADFLTTVGWGYFGAVVKDDETILGGARVMTRAFAPGKCFYYIPDGPVLPENDANAAQVFQTVLDFVQAKRAEDPLRVSHLRLEPRWRQRPEFVRDFVEAKGWLEPRQTLYVDLRGPETGILAQMKPKGRYNIGVAQRNGVTVKEDVSAQGLADFLAIYGETFSRHDLRAKSAEYFDSLLGRLVPLERGSLLFAEYKGMRLATALVTYFGNRATYFFGGSRLADRQVMAPYLLHYEAMLLAKARGHAWYDFYGIAPQDQPDHPWAALSAFKRKFGGLDLSFVPSLDLVYDPASYEEYLA
jgi:lipid II:glycine glycyltransferase (peptidoglycan interpeptide bridge formation enzyme)